MVCTGTVEFPIGWQDLVTETIQNMMDVYSEDFGIESLSVVEGGLLFKLSEGSSSNTKLLAFKARAESLQTCMRCGKKGRAYKNFNGVSIFCTAHSKAGPQLAELNNPEPVICFKDKDKNRVFVDLETGKRLDKESITFEVTHATFNVGMTNDHNDVLTQIDLLEKETGPLEAVTADDMADQYLSQIDFYKLQMSFLEKIND